LQLLVLDPFEFLHLFLFVVHELEVFVDVETHDTTQYLEVVLCFVKFLAEDPIPMAPLNQQEPFSRIALAQSLNLLLEYFHQSLPLDKHPLIVLAQHHKYK
jgi:hypothetical protein